jgi:ABC-type branched-subunit amino acid transport system substrate-binding protein
MVVVIDQPPPGLFAEQNRLIAQGASVAADELNARGGIARGVHIKLIRQSLDGLSHPALEQRLRGERAAVVVLPCDTDSQASLASEAAGFGMLMLAPCNPDPTAGARDASYWPVGTAASDEAAGLASYIRNEGFGNVFVVSNPGSRDVQLLTSYFLGAAQSHGIKIAGSASVGASPQDFSSLVAQIKESHPRPAAIFTALPPPLVGRLLAAVTAQGNEETVFGTSSMDTPLTLTSGGAALENTILASYGFAREDAAARTFATDYRSQFHSIPVGSFPGLGFETIRLIEGAARKANSPEPSALQTALAGGLTLSGVALAERAYLARGDHNPVGPVAIERIGSGSFQPVLASTPKGAPAH